ncbi:hypothetical protein JCM8208_002338 [Rhodotorula glutinis]
MRVHLRAAASIVLEDVGFSLELRPRAGSPGIVEVLSYPPGSTTQPELEPDEHFVEAFGCLGLVELGGKTYLLILVPPVGLATPNEPGMNVERVEEVLSYCVDDLRQLPSANHPSHPCFHLRQVLTDGSFAYSKTIDLTSRLQTRIRVQQQRADACAPTARSGISTPTVVLRHEHGTVEYTWNAYLLEPLNLLRLSLDPTAKTAFDSRSFMVPVIQGYYGARDVEFGADKVTVSVISRRGWARAGTRFKKRGIDGDGSVGNFAETETILETSSHVVSFVQLRGSVPLYWQEKPRLVGAVKLDISQPLADVSLPPFLRHMRWAVKTYGRVHALSFLSDDPHDSLAAEAALGSAYEQLCALGQAQSRRLRDTLVFEKYSIHKAEVLSNGVASMPREIGRDVDGLLDEYGATTAGFDERSGSYVLATEQKGVFRVNCRDCLDRSNLGEFSISAAMLDKQLAKLGLPPLEGSQLEKAHRDLFSTNGDALSQIYAGSRAMNSSFIRTGKVTRAQKLENAEASELRYVQATRRDDDKNRATEILTGQWKEQQWAPQLVLVEPAPSTSSKPSRRHTDSDSGSLSDLDLDV